jgi:predicted extracellular nuclease
MTTATAPSGPPAAPNWFAFQFASANLLNLALPGQSFYANQEPWTEAEFERKRHWLGTMFARLQADVLGVQEVWHLDALRACVNASGLKNATVIAPGTEAGAENTPRVGLVSRWPVLTARSVVEFDALDALPVPEIGLHTRFERPVLHAQVQAPASSGGLVVNVLVCHLKSKRPKYRQAEDGTALEDRDDPAMTARATLRSLLMRAAEAAALRRLVVSLTAGTKEPLVLLGDLNDGPHSVTSQIIAAQQEVAFERKARDTALFHAWDVQTAPTVRRDAAGYAYSHLHQGVPEMLDQVWVSEEFVAGSRFARGDVRRVEVFNDHLQESRERWRSDHGFVRALLRWRVG